MTSCIPVSQNNGYKFAQSVPVEASPLSYSANSKARVIGHCQYNQTHPQVQLLGILIQYAGKKKQIGFTLLGYLPVKTQNPQKLVYSMKKFCFIRTSIWIHCTCWSNVSLVLASVLTLSRTVSSTSSEGRNPSGLLLQTTGETSSARITQSLIRESTTSCNKELHLAGTWLQNK